MNDINDFCHLHVHSMYSILDGENRIENLVKQTKDLGMKQIALTDHGTMMGALEFFKQCQKEGIKPLIGVEAYITDDVDGLENAQKTRDNYHLVMIAQDEVGLENLYYLTSQAQLKNFYFKPRISKHNLTPERVKGIVATSACLGNEVNRKSGWTTENPVYDTKVMASTAAWYQKTFDGRYYLEIQDNDDPAGQQLAYNKAVIQVGKDLGIKNVITSDAHYTTLENSELHSLLMAMQLKKTMEEYRSASEMKYGPWFFVRSPQAMLEASRKYDCEEAFWNTVEIAKSASVNIELGTYKPPEFDISKDPDYEEFLKTRSNDEHH